MRVVPIHVRGGIDLLRYPLLSGELIHRCRIYELGRNDGLQWPRRDGLKWLHLASVVGLG